MRIKILAAVGAVFAIGAAAGYHFGNARAVRLEKACFDETYDDSRETAKFLPR